MGYTKNHISYLYKAGLILLVAGFLAFSCTSCDRSQTYKKLTVAATAVPQGEILDYIKPKLKEKGLKLDVMIVDDYQLPNRLLHEKVIDANFFQHLPFLEEQIDDFGYKITPLIPVHFEPLAIYSSKHQTLNLSPRTIIAIPSDPSNESRALMLLQHHQIIGLKPNIDCKACTRHIESNPYKVKILEIDAPMIPRILKDVDYAVIPGNFALQSKMLKKAHLIACEKTNPMYLNLLVIRDGDDRPELDLLAKELQILQEDSFLAEKYEGVIQIFKECQQKS